MFTMRNCRRSSGIAAWQQTVPSRLADLRLHLRRIEVFDRTRSREPALLISPSRRPKCALMREGARDVGVR
jgi:hypothetical protein